MPRASLLWLLLFLLQVSFIFLISKELVKSLGHFFFKITKSQNKTISILAVLFLPGTIIHELAHILVAGMLFVHVGEIEFLPEIREDGVKLGSAEIGQTDIFRRSIIGVAPLILGLTIIISLLWLNLFNFENTRFLIPGKILLGYIIFVIANTMFSSKKDLEGVGVVVLFFALIFALLYLLKIYLPFFWMLNFLSSNVTFLQKMVGYLVIPILMDCFIFLSIKTLSFKIPR